MQETSRTRKEPWSGNVMRLPKILSKKRAGFTLIELVFVVIVVAILAAAGVAMYVRSLDKARASEGLAILSSVRTHYLVERVENGAVPAGGANLAAWGIATAMNKWWKEGSGFTTSWGDYTSDNNYKVTLIGASTILSGKALSIECETGEIVQDYDYGG